MRTMRRVAVVAALAVWSSAGAPSGPAAAPPAPVFEQPNCIIHARRQVTVGAQASGIIARIPVEEQDRVRQGQMLAQLDDTAVRLMVDRLQAVVAETQSESEARIRLEQAKDDFESAKRLAGTVAAAEVRSAERRFLLAQVFVDRVKYEKVLAQFDLRQAQKRLDDMTLRAPIDGVVLTRHREVGESVEADTHTPVVTLIDVSTLRAEALVPAAKVTAVRLGQRAAVTCDLFPQRPLEGRLVFIEPIVRADVDRFMVKVEFTDPAGQVRPGMRATVRVEG
jgi:RND family efflux transporter MFP subunit